MRKTAKRLAGWMLTLLVVAVGAWSVCADSTVIYDSAARSLVFAPGSDHAPTDLFDSFKGLMPGDIRTQTVTVRNTAADGKAKLYLRSLGARPDSRALLSRLQLCVRPRGSIPLFEAPAAPPRIEQLVCAGEGDVTAAGAAEQRDHDGNEFLGILRGKDMDDRIADGGLGHKSHDQHDDDNNAAEDLGDLADDVVCLLGKENADGKHAADDDAGLFGNADHGIEAE